MSRGQQSYHFVYLTITGEGDLQQLIKDYQLGNRAVVWNKGDIANDRYQFEQSCICIHAQTHPVVRDIDESVKDFLRFRVRSGLSLLPDTFERIVHVVQHGVAQQSHDFVLHRNTIQELAQLQTGLQGHFYQQADDGHDFPYSRLLPVVRVKRLLVTEVGLEVISTTHTLAELSQLLELMTDNSHSWSYGDAYVNDTENVFSRSYTCFYRASGLSANTPLLQQLDALLQLLSAIYTRCTSLFLDYHVEFSIRITAVLDMPYQLLLSQQYIEQLAHYRCSLIMDYSASV